MASSFPPFFSARPNLSSRLSPSQINLHLASPIHYRPPPLNPPPPDPPPPPISTPVGNANLAAGPPTKKWSSLFESKPRNAGSFTPPPMKLVFKGKAIQPTKQIIDAAEEQWNGYLIGHFLDRPLPYSVVTNRLKKLWNPSGGIKIISTGTVFFFHFDSVEDRDKILQADPVLIQNKLFIVRPWATDLGDLNKAFDSVPVWIKLSNLPLVYLSKIGISYLAMRIGKFLCMDLSTEKLDRLEYAKCMVEVSPRDELPFEFPVSLPDGSEQTVHVSYLWRPSICVKCRSFGHTTLKCMKFREDKTKGNPVLDRARLISNSNGVRERNTNTSTGSSLVRPSSEWMRITGKRKEAIGKNPSLNSAKHSAMSREGETSKSRFEVLSTLQEEEAAVDENDECEEGEIRQVSELLSRVFPPYVDKNDNASTLLKACSTSDTLLENHGIGIARKPGLYETGTSSLEIGSGNASLRGDTLDVDDLQANSLGATSKKDGEKVANDSNQEFSDGTRSEEVDFNAANELDNFLQTNFDCVNETEQVEKKQLISKLKAKSKAKVRIKEKGVRENIEALRLEINSGMCEPFVCTEKKKVLDTMIHNYNTMDLYADERELMGAIQYETSSAKPLPPALKPGFLNCNSKESRIQDSTKDEISTKTTCCNSPITPVSGNNQREKTRMKSGPYDHIKPPPGYKAPPELIVNTPTAVTSSGRTMGSAPITRSKKIELLKGLDDDMG